jgi:hypothetical protein
MAYSFIQSAEGSRVTSGTTIAATFSTQNVGAGSLLVAIISRVVGTGTAATIGQVTDNEGNYWKQAVEYDGASLLVGSSRGVDIWYCEKAGGGNKPTVTATVLGSPNNAISGMNMQILEYNGGVRAELIDQIGQANVTTTSVTVTTNGNLAANNDLAISVVTGNMSAATVPSGYTSRLADTTQGFWVADNVATGASSGSPFSAAWTGLTGGSTGSAIIVCFLQSGAQSSTTGPTLLQMSYTDAAFPSAASLTWTSQNYPVNPTPGNTLIALVTGIVNGSVLFNPSNLLSCRAQSITDGAGDTWLNVGESGFDKTSGVDWTMWLCRSALGGTTALTATFNQLATSAAFLLLEFKGLNADLVVDQTASLAGDNTSNAWTRTTGAISAGDIAIAIMSSLPAAVNSVSAGWTQILSDTSGVGYAAMQLSTAAGALTATWSGGPFIGTDILVTALKSASGVGAH